MTQAVRKPHDSPAESAGEVMQVSFKERIAGRRRRCRHALMIGSARAIRCARWMFSSMRWNCAASGLMVDPAATGRPAHHPSPMLKVYIYGYLNRVQSSRRLEHEIAADRPAIVLNPCTKYPCSARILATPRYSLSRYAEPYCHG